jgi:transposase InsO family protein
MVEAGVSFRRQALVFAMPYQTLNAKFTRSVNCPRRTRTIFTEPALVEWIRELKAIHPSWGIRRVRAFISKHTGFMLGRKRTARIMREERLLCSRLTKRVHRTTRKRMTATRINQVWSTDMTSFMLTTGIPLFLVLVMDIFTRRIVGWHLNHRCRAKEWLNALNQALCVEFPDGPRNAELTIRMDNGCQPTSNAYIDTLQTCGITGEWVGFNCPEQNAHIESAIGTLKQDWLWLEECESFDEAHELCLRAITEYNQDHPHSNLNMLSPNEFTQLVKEGRVKITDNNSIEILSPAA